MKRAFTLLELVFVIVIVGILSIIAMPNFQRDTLHEGAHQILSHIRYTQHLAMMDNKFDPTDATWFKTRWQLDFRDPSTDDVYYTIYQDLNKNGSASTTLSNGEIARNPNNPKRMLTSLSTGASAGAKNTPSMNLYKKFNITGITFSNSCTFNGSQRISFDNLGRPLYGNPTALFAPYRDNGGTTGGRLIREQCRITLTSGSDSIIIAIEPETGYAHIL